jgi:hypothetical protein
MKNISKDLKRISRERELEQRNRFGDPYSKNCNHKPTKKELSKKRRREKVVDY